MSLKERLVNVSAWYRIGVVAAVAWLVGALGVIDPWQKLVHFSSFSLWRHSHWRSVLLIGVLPAVVILGGLWIVSGFRKKDR
jgi:hypothetical protein